MIFDAIGAGAADFEFVFKRSEIVLASDRGNEKLEFLGVEVDEFTAGSAVQMVVMRLEWTGEFIALFPAKWYDFGDTKCREEFESAIDTHPVYRGASQDNVLDEQRLVGVIECPKHGFAGFGEAEAFAGKDGFEFRVSSHCFSIAFYCNKFAINIESLLRWLHENSIYWKRWQRQNNDLFSLCAPNG